MGFILYALRLELCHIRVGNVINKAQDILTVFSCVLICVNIVWYVLINMSYVINIYIAEETEMEIPWKISMNNGKKERVKYQNIKISADHKT